MRSAFCASTALMGSSFPSWLTGAATRVVVGAPACGKGRLITGSSITVLPTAMPSTVLRRLGAPFALLGVTGSGWGAASLLLSTVNLMASVAALVRR